MNRVKPARDAVLDAPPPASAAVAAGPSLAESELLGQSPASRLSIVMMVGLALLCSGAAALVNEVVWQRSLKRFLGGSETVSSMLVVLVFMLGLGVGSILMGRRAGRVKDPLRAFALVEGLLAVVNLGVCLLLRSDLTDSIYHFQLLAASSGAPLPVLFGGTAAVILLAPCLLMGATMPLASETCQRRLELTNPRVLGLLFFINTLGSVAGAVAASFFLIPYLGFTSSLGLGIGLNVLAALLLLVLGSILGRSLDSPAPEEAGADSLSDAPVSPALGFRPRPAEVLALVVGFCSLGYEMLLFRFFALEFEPLPYTFASVLAGFLLFWSLGAGASSGQCNWSVAEALRLCAVTVLLPLPGFYLWWALKAQVLTVSSSLAGWVLLVLFFFLVTLGNFVPCFLFGYLFGKITSEVAKSWGYDVGRIYAWNTLGSCLGIVAVTFVGYEMHVILVLLVLALLLFGLRDFWLAQGKKVGRRVPGWAFALGLSLAVIVTAFSADLSAAFTTGRLRMFFGRAGVLGVDRDGNLIWDGLWHSKLSSDNDHVGENNWQLAVCPLLSHSTGEVRDVCVVGLGTGITAATLAKLASVERVDIYDINRGLEEFHTRYPEGTLRVLENPKVRMIWQDVRAGFALRERRYDIIVTQPLYLKQAGSGLLNSVEFLSLVRERLKPSGVLCLYSQGTEAQKLAMRATAARVFPHGETFYGGYLLVLSNEPLSLDAESLRKRFGRHAGDPLWREIRGFKDTKDADAVLKLLDRPRLSWDTRGLVVTDDHPLVEYPGALEEMMKARDVAWNSESAPGGAE